MKLVGQYRCKLIVAMTSLCFVVSFWPAPGMSQVQQASAPSPARLFTADPRVQVHTYRLEGADIDVPYCVFASSKISRTKPAPLIVSLHGFGAGPQIMCNKTAIDLAEADGYILVAPMGYSISGWYGSPVIHLGARRRSSGSEGHAGGGSGAPVTSGPAGLVPPVSQNPAGTSGPSDEDIKKWSEADVMNVLAKMRAEFKVDPKRIYLTGHSMGGAGTLFLAAKHADIWAAVAAVAPASFMMNETRGDILRGIKRGAVPVLIVQGDADSVVPVTNTRLWVESMKQMKLDYRYVELPGIDHGPVITASQAAVYQFFGAHAKK